MVRVLLLPVTESLARELWAQGHSETDWPNFLKSWPSFMDHIGQFWALDALGLGSLKIVTVDDGICGFVTITDADERFLPDGIRGVECGTYLLERFRHTGLNASVKRECFREVFARTTVDCCLFVVATRNARAIRALEKLGLRRWSDDSLASTDMDLRPYLRRKSWEQGESCVLFVLWRQQHEPCMGQSSSMGIQSSITKH